MSISYGFASNTVTQLHVTNTGVSLNSGRILVDPDMQAIVDSWAKGTVTNGLACGVAFARPSGIMDPLPVFYVNVINTTTNFIIGYLNLPFEALVSIGLFDSDGKPVAKTTAGQRVGTWTQQQIEDWFNKSHQNRSQSMTKSGSITSTLFPLSPSVMSIGISVSNMFQLKKAGEYTLHLRMRFTQVKEDVSGRFSFQSTWLPEVVAKVQIKPGDILPDSKTNSPTM